MKNTKLLILRVQYFTINSAFVMQNQMDEIERNSHSQSMSKGNEIWVICMTHILIRSTARPHEATSTSKGELVRRLPFSSRLLSILLKFEEPYYCNTTNPSAFFQASTARHCTMLSKLSVTISKSRILQKAVIGSHVGTVGSALNHRVVGGLPSACVSSPTSCPTNCRQMTTVEEAGLGFQQSATASEAAAMSGYAKIDFSISEDAMVRKKIHYSHCRLRFCFCSRQLIMLLFLVGRVRPIVIVNRSSRLSRNLLHSILDVW
jgi:hypothetical protein